MSAVIGRGVVEIVRVEEVVELGLEGVPVGKWKLWLGVGTVPVGEESKVEEQAGAAVRGVLRQLRISSIRMARMIIVVWMLIVLSVGTLWMGRKAFLRGYRVVG